MSTIGVRHAFLARLAPARLVLEVLHVAGADVLAEQQLIAREVLEDHADAIAQRRLVPLAQILAVEQDAARTSAGTAA